MANNDGLRTIDEIVADGDHAEEETKLAPVTANRTAAILNELSGDINEWAKDKGFWESAEDAEWLEQQAEHIFDSDPVPEDRVVAAHMRNIAARIRTLLLAAKIALMHSELSEALETLRDTGADNLDDNFMEELADTLIRIGDTAGQIPGKSLGDVVIEKMRVNETRPHKHGRVM